MIELPERAISMSQPWVWAVLNCGKDIENRRWPTRFRGPITLHAAKSWDWDGVNWLEYHGFPVPEKGDEGMPFGAYVGRATLTDCWELAGDEDPAYERPFWAFGPWCFVLKDVRALPEPIPAKGRLGIYRRPELIVPELALALPFPEEPPPPLQGK